MEKQRVFSSEIYLNTDDKELLNKFQNHRNQVMHLGMSTSQNETLNESIWFMVRIINQLEWQDTLPMKDQYLANSLKSLLGNNLYQRLLKSSAISMNQLIVHMRCTLMI